MKIPAEPILVAAFPDVVKMKQGNQVILLRPSDVSELVKCLQQQGEIAAANAPKENK